MDRSSGPSPGSAGSPSLDVLDGFEASQGRNMEGPVPISDAPLPWNIFKFYHESSPWTPLGLGGAAPARLDGHRGHGRPAMVSNQPGVSGDPWQDYRNNAASECGNVPLPSDSGYSSQHRPGMDNASICTGGVSRDQDLQSVTDPFRRLGGFGQDTLNQNQDAIRQMGSWRDPATNKLWCQHCNKTVKNRSELKKHDQRHVKPFVCDELECPRKQQGKPQGFSTRNDLERHKKTVHNKSTSGVHYRCNLDQCKTKNKLWPRADNFRSHLKRIHHREYSAEESLDAFIDRQAAQCSQGDLEGVGSSVAPLYHMYHDSALDMSPDWPSMDLDAPQNRIAPEACQDDQQKTELDLDKMPFPAAFPDPRSGHHAIPQVSQTTLDQLVQRRLSLDASAQPPAPPPTTQRTDSGMLPPRSCDKDGGRCFPPRRPNSGTPKDPSSHIEERRQNLLTVDSNNGSSHHTRRESAKTPAAGPSTNGKNPISSTPNTADLHEQNYDSGDHADIHIECGGMVSAPVKEPGQGGLPRLSAEHGLEEEEVMKLLEQLPQHLVAKFLKKSNHAKKGSAVATQNGNAAGGNRNSASNTKSLHDCPDAGCDRKFPRKCELKKHMKRHDKPYGCTFPPCTKKFGSKSDWKRHENSQHFQLEIWECDEKKHDAPNEQCTKICYRRETFKHHLQKEHHIEDQNKLEEKQEKCRVGRHCDAKFWCGFCEQSIEVTQSRLNAWTVRFNHIDDHFSGRNNVPKKEISEWKSVDLDLPELDLSSPAEESRCSSPLSTQSSTTSSAATDNQKESDSPGSSHAQSKRRRAENDATVSAQAHQSKRQRNDVETNQMWLCCQCSSPALVKTTPVCLSSGLAGSRCDHARCKNCQISSYTPNESKQRGAKNVGRLSV